MLSFITQAALTLALTGTVVAQGTTPANRFKSGIPQTEAVALTQIVEDDPANLPAARSGGDDESPAYTLYSATLPIPPVAQVKQ